MLMPSIFGENLFDDWFDEFPFYDMDKEMNNTEKKLYGKKAGRIMKTDIKEQKDGYELMIDLPGFTKDEIKASVSDGYLTISAAKGLDKDEKEKDSGHYIRKERYAGACQRSFYVGPDVTEEDISGRAISPRCAATRLSMPQMRRCWGVFARVTAVLIMQFIPTVAYSFVRNVPVSWKGRDTRKKQEPQNIRMRIICHVNIFCIR